SPQVLVVSGLLRLLERLRFCSIVGRFAALARHDRLYASATVHTADGCHTARPTRASASAVTRFLRKSSWSLSEILMFAPSRMNSVAARPQSATTAIVGDISGVWIT